MTQTQSSPQPQTRKPVALTLCEVGETGIDGFESYSMFCMKVHRALRLADLSYERRHGQIEDFADLNPAQQVPVLLVDGQPLSDSTDICRRIDELVGGGLLLPKDPVQRAGAQLWEELADTSLNGFTVAARWADDRNWPRARDAFFGMVPEPAREEVANPIRDGVKQVLHGRNVWRTTAEECWRRFSELLDQLEVVAPQKGFWTGNAINVADLAIFAQLQGLRIGLTPWQAEQVEKRPKLTEYLERVDGKTRA